MLPETKKKNQIIVSVIIPCRNEEKFISKCLDSLLSQDYPKEKLEVLVVDGMSEDKTKEILKSYIRQYSFILILDNPKKTTPCAMNIGIRNSIGEIIIKIDAHSTYESDYISKCVKYLNNYDAHEVGGVLVTVPEKDTLIGKSIAFVLSNQFGAGNSYFKTGSKELKWVDAVAFGCFKKEVFERIGFYNEVMTRSQDIELNLRLKKSGGKILLVPDIVGYYYAKSNLIDFFAHNFIDGIWVTYPLKFGIKAFSLRHLTPFLFVLTLISLAALSALSSIFFWLLLSILSLYFLINLYFSFKITIREKDFRYIFLMPIVFATRHISYGLGSIWGLIKII